MLDSVSAVAAASEALRLYKSAGNKAGQAAALLAITTADYDNENGKAVSAAEERATLFRESGQPYQEAEALATLANVYVARIGKRIARCSVAPSDDSIAALRAARDAHGLFSRSRSHQGEEAMSRVAAQVLQYNNVNPDNIAAVVHPGEVYQDVLDGQYANAGNSLPRKGAPKNISKVEEVIPSAKQLERGRFAWTNPLAGYSYSMTWTPLKDRKVRRKPRGSYDLLGINGGSRTTAIPALVEARAHDASERGDPVVVFMVPPDARHGYATTIMTAVQVIAAMITAKLPRLVFVQFDEPQWDPADTDVRQCSLHPSLLGLLRSCRLEAPNVVCGYVGGDAASWHADPTPLINAIFEVIESDETEHMYKRGEGYGPLLIHKPLDEAVQYVKPQKKKAWDSVSNIR